jgi:hypothetical protein
VRAPTPDTSRPYGFPLTAATRGNAAAAAASAEKTYRGLLAPQDQAPPAVFAKESWRQELVAGLYEVLTPHFETVVGDVT